MNVIKNILIIASIGTIGSGLQAQSIMVAGEDFDGGALNLISSNVPTMDGGGGDTHAVGATQAWPTAGATPFSLADNSVGDVGDTTAFAGDTEGIYGVNSDFTNNFLGISDSDEFGDVVSTWTFDISSATGPLELRVGLGSMEGSTFSYDLAALLAFEVSIDGGILQNAISISANASGDGYNYRALDNGVVITANDNALLATGDNGVIKLLAEDGSISANAFLDKTPASGPGAGILDSFSTAIDGTGSELVLTLTSSIAFEAVAIDDIGIYSVPEPSTFVLLSGMLALGFALYRRQRN